MSKYEYIDSCKNDPAQTNPVFKMCTWLTVSTSGFYHWSARPQSATAARRGALTARVRHFFEASHGTYGYRRIHADLAGEDTECSPELVRQIMREEHLTPCQPRPFRVTTQADAEAVAQMPDLVKRDFTADRPGIKFVGDITYIHTWAGFIYLATVIDCCSKKVVGWSIADHMRTELVEDALKNAAATTVIEPRAIFHSDRGSVGEFNWSSQHLVIAEVCDGESQEADSGRADGCAAAMGSGSCVAATDALTGPARAVASGAAGLLAANRVGSHDGRGLGVRGRVLAGRVSMVPSRWRHAAYQPGRAHGPLPVVR